MVWALALLAALKEDDRPLVVLQPLGPVSKVLVSRAKAALAVQYEVRVEVAGGRQLPVSAFYTPRSRYRAEKLLTFLLEKRSGARTVVGLTQADISTTKGKVKDWGLFGLGTMSGHSCVVSSYRLGKKGAKTRAQRFDEVVVHEVGHTFGLPHCPDRKCVMADAEGALKSVDDASGHLCSKCVRQIGALAKRGLR